MYARPVAPLKRRATLAVSSRGVAATVAALPLRHGARFYGLRVHLRKRSEIRDIERARASRSVYLMYSLHSISPLPSTSYSSNSASQTSLGIRSLSPSIPTALRNSFLSIAPLPSASHRANRLFIWDMDVLSASLSSATRAFSLSPFSGGGGFLGGAGAVTSGLVGGAGGWVGLAWYGDAGGSDGRGAGDGNRRVGGESSGGYAVGVCIGVSVGVSIGVSVDGQGGGRGGAVWCIECSKVERRGTGTPPYGGEAGAKSASAARLSGDGGGLPLRRWNATCCVMAALCCEATALC